jgi:hypothetical protein
MFGHFRIIPFIIGVAVGSVLLYLYKPEKQVITMYPHPSKTEDKIFRDHNKVCYKYTTHEVNCDANEGTLKDYPIQK